MKKTSFLVTLGLGILAMGLISTSFIMTPAVETGSGYVTVEIQDRTFTKVPVGTVLSVLQALDAENPTLKLETKAYVGLGTLVTTLYGLENGTEQKYWQYEVNGAAPLVAVDAYMLAPGDLVTWEFKESEM